MPEDTDDFLSGIHRLAQEHNERRTIEESAAETSRRRREEFLVEFEEVAERVLEPILEGAEEALEAERIEVSFRHARRTSLRFEVAGRELEFKPSPGSRQVTIRATVGLHPPTESVGLDVFRDKSEMQSRVKKFVRAALKPE